jgi:tRNA-Thr(GGU) m(6)t(6)A37 methyltransferase TsaA
MEPSRKKPKGEPTPGMQLRQVGVVRSPLKEPSLVADSGDLEWQSRVARATESRGVISKLVIDNDLAGITDGLEGFSHLLVLYWAHLVPPEGRSIIKAHPMGRKELPVVGIFATCSPARPNNICATVVRLLKCRGNTLTVEGLDALDGSPIVDIKPYNPSYYPTEGVKVTDWMERIHREIAGGSIAGDDSEETR